jgi:hypothetical protein
MHSEGGISKIRTTILFLAGNPTEQAWNHLGKELSEIEDSLRQSRNRSEFELVSFQAVRPRDIIRIMAETRPNIVHFSGQAMESGELVLSSILGEPEPVPVIFLERLFEKFSDSIDCVVLNASYSETQAIALSAHISFVVCMNQEVEEKAAIAFSIGFYTALGANQSIERAYELGCVQIGLENLPTSSLPILIKRKVKKYKVVLTGDFDELKELEVNDLVDQLKRFLENVTLEVTKIEPER